MEVLDVTQADMTEMMTTGEEAGIETGQGAAVLGILIVLSYTFFLLGTFLLSTYVIHTLITYV